MRKLFTICVLILTVIAVYLLWNGKTIEMASEPTSTPSVTSTTYEWVFQEGETGSSGVPNTAVSLKVNGKSYPLGNYDGSCKEVGTNETGVLSEKANVGEISRVQCFFAGFGYELGVFKAETRATVKVGDIGVSEEGGKPFRGNWKTLLEL